LNLSVLKRQALVEGMACEQSKYYADERICGQGLPIIVTVSVQLALHMGSFLANLPMSDLDHHANSLKKFLLFSFDN